MTTTTENQEQSDTISDPVKKEIIISFDDYLKKFLDIRNEEEYKYVVEKFKKTEISKFPDLYKPHLDKARQDDIDTKIIPLNQTNTLYGTLVKFLALNNKKALVKNENGNKKEDKQ